MKRLIAAVSFAVLAVPAFAGAPYDQNEVDRALPQIAEKARAPKARAPRGLPFDQVQIDRALPAL